MKTLSYLPDDYRELCAIDLEKNKRSALYINLLGVLITLVMAIVMNTIIPLSSLFERDVGVGSLLLRIVVLAVLLVGYIVLHDLTHGFAMKLCGARKVVYGFSGMYAFAGCHDFFSKNVYLIISLAPVVFWGIIINIVCFLVPSTWFWIFYIIQIANIAGSAGDYYVIFHFLFLPDDILVYDTGTAMTIYSAQK